MESVHESGLDSSSVLDESGGHDMKLEINPGCSSVSASSERVKVSIVLTPDRTLCLFLRPQKGDDFDDLM